MKRIMLAGIQMESCFWETQNNLAHATSYIETAARQSAQMNVMLDTHTIRIRTDKRVV